MEHFSNNVEKLCKAEQVCSCSLTNMLTTRAISEQGEGLKALKYDVFMSTHACRQRSAALVVFMPVEAEKSCCFSVV